MPVRSTPEMATSKWVQNLSASTERAKAGALAVTVAPGVSAAKAADKWIARTTAAKPKYIANVSRVSLQQWQDAYINIGLNRISTGAQGKQNKVLAFQQDFQAYLKRGIAQIDAMPKNTVDDGIARAVAMIRYNAKYQRGTSA